MITPQTLKVAGARIDYWDARALFRATQGEDPLEWQGPYLDERRNAVVLKGRQIGASTSAGVLGIRTARAWPGSTVGIVSPSQNQSKEVKERAKGGLIRIGEPLLKDNETLIQLRNRSRILSLPGSAKSVRGWTFDLLVIDEAAFLDEETFLAARATVATGGRTIVQSTPAGPFGPFYDLFQEAVPVEDSFTEDGVPIPFEFVSFRVRSDEVPTISPEFLARERATLSAEQFAQEYEATFTAAGLGLIDPERLRQASRPTEGETDVWGGLK